MAPRRPTNLGYLSARLYPSTVIDNWAAAWKVSNAIRSDTKQATRAELSAKLTGPSVRASVAICRRICS